MVVPSAGPFCCVQRQGDLMSVPQALAPDPRDTRISPSSPSSEVTFFSPYTKDFKNERKKILADLPSVEVSGAHGRGTPAVGLVVGTAQPLFCFIFAQKSETLPRNKGWMLHF